MKKEYGLNIEMYANKANKGYPHQKKYIVEAKWWRKWCDYTGFELVSPKRGRSPDHKSTFFYVPDQN